LRRLSEKSGITPKKKKEATSASFWQMWPLGGEASVVRRPGVVLSGPAAVFLDQPRKARL